ncbi:AraC family transcriptional regulator [Paraburkholderia acidicola]|uniref:AraC family transcriptional regulator n=1 Tax=Paraburkholderia acidicola TaxID=1912599 RepID=A0A2A4ERX6_9BURK|nr:AraC family transcriptional regulator [Paraburkholderia acidicola]PCE23170.1 AraC family transcriptional regulator [Paraburkholderia acidicola]
MNSVEHNAEANLRVHLLRCLADTCKDMGIDPERLCMGLGFDVADLSDPSCRVSLRQAGTMIQRALSLAPGCGLGLETGTRETIASIGLVGYAMLTSRTLMDAAALNIRLQKHTGPLLHFDLTTDERIASICATNHFFESDVEIFLVEEAFSSAMKLAYALVGDGFRPAAVDLTYRAPSYAAQYSRIFKCPVRFEQASNVFSVDAAWGTRPIATYDPLAHRQALLLLQAADTQEDSGTDFLESIARIIRRDLRNAPLLATVATQLCMSERTLRRRLTGSGVSYQTLVNDIRQKRAYELLNNPRLTVDYVAREVGFTDSHNFRRAFKRWTGHGPRESR